MVYRILVKLSRVYAEESDLPMKNRLEGVLDPDLTFSSTYYPLPKPLFHTYKVTAERWQTHHTLPNSQGDKNNKDMITQVVKISPQISPGGVWKDFMGVELKDPSLK